MRRFLHFITKYPMATGLAIALAGFLGVYASLHMPVDLFPDLDVPVVNVVSHHPGAGPEDVEFLISRPIEAEMRTIPGVKRVASTSIQGISQVTIEFSWGTGIRDARQLVEGRLARLHGTLPQNVSPRIENIGTTLQEVCDYVIYAAGDPVALRNTVRYDLAGRLMSVPGVSSVEVLGGERRAFSVTLRPEALARAHLSVAKIVAALKHDNVTAVAGFLERSGREYLVRGDAKLTTLADLRALAIVNAGGPPVRLDAIADIHEAHVPKHYTVRGNGFPAVAVLVRKQPGASTIDVVSGVEASLAELRRLLPPGSIVKKFYDQSEIIRDARQEILQDLLVGAALAVVLLYFFLGSIRLTLVVAITIPVTLLVTVAFMGWLGLSFNVVTMTALALAIGMIVDDAIIVAENVFRHAQSASSAREACIEGALEIAGPDASGTFTTVAAFFPLLLMTGLAALFMRPFGLTISVALLVSLLLSLTLVPTLLGRLKRLASSTNRPLGAWLLARLDAALQGTLRFALRHTWVVLCLATLFLGLAGLTAFLGKAAVLPPIDEGAVLIEYVMPPGTSLRESNRVGAVLDRIALADPDVSCVYRRTGSPETGSQIEGVNKGELLVKLKKTERRRTATAIVTALKRAYSPMSGVVFLYHQPTQEKIDESFSGLPALFGVTIYGTDAATLNRLAGRVEGILAEDESVENVVNNTKVKASQIDVRLNRAELSRYGMVPADALTALKAARFGVEATRIVRQQEDVAVRVRLDAGEMLDLEHYRQLPVGFARGAPVPLERVADIRIRHVPAAITRLNGQREITLVAEVEGDIPAIVSRLRKRFQTIEVPDGYSIAFTGQYKVLIETAVELLFAVAAAIVLIYLILAMQFRSWLQPLVILATIPLALVGALIALFVTGQGLDVSVGMGAVTLVGVAVNNAIVLTDYANRKTASGANLAEALLEAASVRLRPILLTTLTTIAALLPTAIGTTGASSVFQPFAVTVIGGLLSTVLVTLVVIPTLAAAVMDRKPRPSENIALTESLQKSAIASGSDD